MNDRKVVLAVVGFLGVYALASLAIIATLALVLITMRITITAEIVAVLAIIANPMSAALGAIGGLLASTKSAPESPDLYSMEPAA